MCEPVSLLRGDITAPLAHFDISFEQCRMQDRLRELVTDGRFLFRARRLIVEWTVGKCRALTLWFPREVWNVDGWEFDLGLLLISLIGRWRVEGKLVEQVLLVILVDLCGKSVKAGDDMI